MCKASHVVSFLMEIEMLRLTKRICADLQNDLKDQKHKKTVKWQSVWFAIATVAP